MYHLRALTGQLSLCSLSLDLLMKGRNMGLAEKSLRSFLAKNPDLKVRVTPAWLKTMDLPTDSA
jgi:hypothetical protein